MKEEAAKNLIHLLDCNNQNSEIEYAIEKLLTLGNDQLHMLILPELNKNLWENAAIVLKRIGFPGITPVIPHLIEWLKDINWPGTNTVIEVLGTVNINILVPHIENALIKAQSECDEMWIGGIKILLKKNDPGKDCLNNKGLYKILDLADWC